MEKWIREKMEERSVVEVVVDGCLTKKKRKDTNSTKIVAAIEKTLPPGSLCLAENQRLIQAAMNCCDVDML